MKNIWILALYASLPAFAMSGCTCGSHANAGCQPSSCNLTAEQQACTTAADCASDSLNEINACNLAVCSGGVCSTTRAPDGPASPDQQTPGDCTTLVCSSGQLVEQAAADPPTIAGDCQVGACNDGEIAFVNAADGTSCIAAGGTSACVGGHCLRLPDDITLGTGGAGGAGTGGAGTGGAGDAGTDDAGTGDAGDAGDAGSGDAGTGGAGTGGAGGAGGGPSTCIRCAEMLYGGAAATLCPSSVSVYAALADCICLQSCAGQCQGSICAHAPMTMTCASCVASVSDGCGSQLTSCNDDF